jgi:hypothetical protein
MDLFVTGLRWVRYGHMSRLAGTVLDRPRPCGIGSRVLHRRGELFAIAIFDRWWSGTVAA